MMDTKFTPGPWAIFVQPVVDRDEAKTELAKLVDGTPEFQPHVVMISAPNGLAPAVTGCSVNSMANAHLISAAPDLYEALERCGKILDHYFIEIGSDGNDALDAAKAALSKARGES